jgi:hypothetical protein
MDAPILNSASSPVWCDGAPRSVILTRAALEVHGKKFRWGAFVDVRLWVESLRALIVRARPTAPPDQPISHFSHITRESRPVSSCGPAGASH